MADGFPEHDASQDDDKKTKMTDEARSPSKSWRDMAQKVQGEPDPRKMTELVEQLIAMLDQEQARKISNGKRDTGKTSNVSQG